MITIEESLGIIQKVLVQGFKKDTGGATLFSNVQRFGLAWGGPTDPGSDHRLLLTDSYRRECDGIESLIGLRSYDPFGFRRIQS